jgi:serpin B
MLPILPTLALTLTLPCAAVPQEAQSVFTANNQFALDLYGRLCGQQGNLFLSPYSISKTLAMAYAGARGDTAREMASVLHFSLGPTEQARAFAKARRILNAPPTDGFISWGKPSDELRLAASLWGQKGYGFQKDYLALTQECFGASLREVDFRGPEDARKTINAWVEQQTDHKIKDLFPPTSLDVNTRLVLVSAIYFKGNWASPFAKNATRPEPFLSQGRKVPVPTMSQTGTFGYFENDDLQGLQMPYAGGEYALVVLLPRKADGLAELERALTAERLAGWTAALREQEVQVSLPKFKLTTAFSLREELEALGMRRAFGGGADFSGMNGGHESLYVSAVVHSAFVDVHEEGTEAAAATGVAVGSLSLPQRRPPVFRADHPFVFAIRDVRTGLILFMGRVVQP